MRLIPVSIPSWLCCRWSSYSTPGSTEEDGKGWDGERKAIFIDPGQDLHWRRLSSPNLFRYASEEEKREIQRELEEGS